MEPTSSTDYDDRRLCEQDRRALLKVASASVEHGVRHHQALQVDPTKYTQPLQEKRATFVTLRHQKKLRGCIGVIEPVRPLIEDVANNAWSAASKDPRFPALKSEELNGLSIHISVLSPPSPIRFDNENSLLDQIRPGIDGLLLEEPSCQARSTFLPAVWDTLTDRDTFWKHLKAKAGLPTDYWSNTLLVSRYTAESIG